MPDTLASLRAEIQLESRGDFSGSPDEDTIVNAAINDAIEDIWMAMMQVNLARFFGEDSPVSFSLAAGAERYQIVAIQDPTVAPTVIQVAGGNLNDGAQFYVGYTYVTESGSETKMSPTVQTAARVADNLFQVAAPPNPGNAFGWNCYAGEAQDEMALQNQQALPFGPVAGSPPYTEPVTEWQPYPVFQKIPPVDNTTGDNLSWIQHLEIRTSDTLLRAWNQVDIDSEVMRRMARTISSATEYQTYVWDLDNTGTLEFRPMLGLNFQPRYWYVAKPRRLRYDQAPIPYQNVTGVHPFLKFYAKQMLYLGVNEFLNAQGWQGAADGARMKIQQSLMQESWKKNSRIVPYLFTT
jgi:hypothetical protein